MKISVYLDDGRVFEYDGVPAEKAREHAFAIASQGYCHNDGKGEMEYYPSHRIAKVKASGGTVPTKYPDTTSAT